MHPNPYFTEPKPIARRGAHDVRSSTKGLAATAAGLTASVALAATLPQAAFAKMTSPIAMEFPRGVATKMIQPTHVAVVHFGMPSLTIPAGTLSGPVDLTIPQGMLGSYAVPKGQKPLFDFVIQAATPAGTPVAVPFAKITKFALETPQRG